MGEDQIFELNRPALVVRQDAVVPSISYSLALAVLLEAMCAKRAERYRCQVDLSAA
ncbi:hypothetical protein [Frankia sp. AgB32]|uniref:hypothetical protein n=1 Tax=Frankia sp. AgB32 TaxID=631119 RepID=UPI00200EB3B1|nr:hypothetical protein [Frankia sp. AgB32]MCK9895056.1 hypothetical protein [Frankia sp. AgB32]